VAGPNARNTSTQSRMRRVALAASWVKVLKVPIRYARSVGPRKVGRRLRRPETAVVSGAGRASAAVLHDKGRDHGEPRRSQQLAVTLLWQGDRQAPQHSSRCGQKVPDTTPTFATSSANAAMMSFELAGFVRRFDRGGIHWGPQWRAAAPRRAAQSEQAEDKNCEDHTGMKQKKERYAKR
jgi:hypothetical protein